MQKTKNKVCFRRWTPFLHRPLHSSPWSDQTTISAATHTKGEAVRVPIYKMI